MSENFLHKVLFFSLLIAYPIMYAPYGINETDGGFITGLAWQILQGKQLYSEVIYVRPPLTVWLRALEMRLLPTDWAVLAERVFFYWKIGISAWLAADSLAFRKKKWMLAALGFVVSAHCYPAAAWHTVDGILFGSLAFWFLFKKPNSLIFSALAGVFTVMSMLCKQSFFPLAVVFFAVVAIFFWKKKMGIGQLVAAVVGFFGAVAAFFFYLKISGAWSAYFEWTAGAGSFRDFFQHGFVDFFRISPQVLGFVLAGAVLGFLLKFLKKGIGNWPVFALAIAGLIGSYLFQVIENQSFTPPFGQSRLLFDASFLWLVFLFFQKKWDAAAVRFAAFLSLSWMASISWGYNLPVLCATPLVFGVWEIGVFLTGSRPAVFFLKNGFLTAFFNHKMAQWLLLAALVFTFFVGNQFIYRDGRRHEMTEPLSEIFPKLESIKSDPETYEKYLELREFHEKYGANLTVVPSFPLADFLLGTRPVLPIDWESSLETNGHNELIINVLEEKMPIVLVEKNYGDRLFSDPKFAATKWLVEHFSKIGESENFWVYRPNN